MAYWKSPEGSWRRLKGVVRALRQAPTEAECRLWEAIRAKRFHDLKFRRQHSIGQFVVDFYCGSEGLVIEVDGGIHQKTTAEDTARMQYLESLGLNVIRFSNEEVLGDLGAVLRRIEAETSPRPHGHPAPD